MKKETFLIETNDGQLAKYKGITLGHLWNGWECPMFELSTTKKILSEWLSTENDKYLYDFTFYQYDELFDVIIETSFSSGKIETISTSQPITINNIKYYSIGAYNWTWTKKNNN
jgi:hypothetical protein